MDWSVALCGPTLGFREGGGAGVPTLDRARTCTFGVQDSMGPQWSGVDLESRAQGLQSLGGWRFGSRFMISGFMGQRQLGVDPSEGFGTRACGVGFRG